MKRTAVRGGELTWVEDGPADDPEPLLLIAPLGGSLSLWAHLRAELASERRVVSYDHRGTGGSSRLLGFPTTRELARDAVGLLDALGIARAHLFGESLGGMVATWLLADAKERVATVTIASAPLRAGLPDRLGRAAWLAGCFARRGGDLHACLTQRILSSRFRSAHPDAVSYYQRIGADAPPRRRELSLLLLAALRHDARSAEFPAAVPALVLAGARDVLVPVDRQRPLAQALMANLVVVPDAGHAISLEQPAILARTILDHCRSH